MAKNPVKIKDLDELKDLASKNTLDCFILLNFGLRSSKDISYNPTTKLFHVFNYIDDTEQDLTEEQLDTDSNIMLALQRGALYMRP